MAGKIDSLVYHETAIKSGFQLSGVAAALPHRDAFHYTEWVAAGYAGEMRYLTDYRAEKRADPRSLLPTAKSVLCLGMLYNGPEPHTDQFDSYERGWISRYAWGSDYHSVITARLHQLVAQLQNVERFDYKICCDTAPLLERSYARQAGLGWIGRNTCLIHEGQGSWFFLGEVLTSLDLPANQPSPDRCGTCHRCIEACPTQAIVPLNGLWTVDSRRCISYLTIELRGAIPEEHRPRMAGHLFGCDICQDVCPWNNKAPTTREPEFASRHAAPPLDRLASLTSAEFRALYRDTPIDRARYTGFLRNVAVAIGNSGNPSLIPAAVRLANSRDAVVAEHAQWAVRRLRNPDGTAHRGGSAAPSGERVDDEADS